ncbi:HAD superfamily hydrolase (TIGR01509 family) [Bradyrhizobium sp. USDA 4524]|uniref:HAD family hydrolase n=1 Tax=unclassified Bradyrhizobium TaxID=2631580 RepID=UPI0020A19533|nr:MULTISPECIES: HAD family hydrolase [unclassified Bradyrhizobium]MCP1845972.1 HAD superfamily hydrolase (TIGR01509 family) [Bradyrhizobium sp. USDA 4538]MCP1907394.1 HAD superfamily hydrolase (TIGR01509 family) [Bradyrhizobium sp. USDA 4537]MCP1985180.1 HAD superfamily hydrolase (TIGR01509 family) [Bradyrhizobium sp. USDA 4539]
MAHMRAQFAVPELVVFDLDGTLLDSSLSMRSAFERAFRRASPASDVIPFHELLARQGIPFKDITRELQWPASLPALFEEESIASLSLNRLFPAVGSLLTGLAANGTKLGLFTGKARARTLLLLEHFGLERAFSGIVCGDDPLPGKPSADGLHHIIATTGSHAGRCVFVGDSMNDLKAAQGASVRFLPVRWPGQPELFPRGCVRRIIADIELLLDCCGGGRYV